MRSKFRSSAAGLPTGCWNSVHPLWTPIWTTRASCGQGRPDQAGTRDPATPESSSHPTPPHTDVPPSLTVVSTCQSSGTPHPPPAAPGRASPTTPVDRRVTQPPTPPSLGSHTHSLALEKVFFFFSSSTLVLFWAVSPMASLGRASRLSPSGTASYHPNGLHGPTVRGAG